MHEIAFKGYSPAFADVIIVRNNRFDGLVFISVNLCSIIIVLIFEYFRWLYYELFEFIDVRESVCFIERIFSHLFDVSLLHHGC